MTTLCPVRSYGKVLDTMISTHDDLTFTAFCNDDMAQLMTYRCMSQPVKTIQQCLLQWKKPATGQLWSSLFICQCLTSGPSELVSMLLKRTSLLEIPEVKHCLAVEP